MKTIKFVFILMPMVLFVVHFSRMESFPQSNSALKHYEKALHYLEIKDPKKIYDAEVMARKELEVILNKYPDSEIAIDTYYKLEELTAGRGMGYGIPEGWIKMLYAFRKKLAAHNKIVEERPLAHFEFGVTYFRLKKYDKAIHELKKSLALYENPKKQYERPKWLPSNIYHLLGGCYEAKKMNREALEAFEKANEIEPYRDKKYIKKIKKLKEKVGQ